MPRPHHLFRSPGARLLVLAVLCAAALAVACGGGSGGDSDEITENDAREFANHYFLTTFGLFTGQTEPDEFVELFAPECREDVDLGGLAFVLLFIQGVAPGLQDIEVEEVDLGGINVEQTAEGALISPVNGQDLRLKVDGEFRTAAEVFAGAGLEESTDQDLTDPEPVLLVRRNGDLYVGDCSELEGIAGG